MGAGRRFHSLGVVLNWSHWWIRSSVVNVRVEVLKLGLRLSLGMTTEVLDYGYDPSISESFDL